jgi:hypothetical protein
VHTAYKKAARAPTTASRPTPAWAAAPVDWGTPAEDVPLAPPDEAVEAAGLEADPEAEPEGLAELATGTLLLPAGAEGATTGAELPAGAETAGAELKTGGATARALLVTIHEQ